MKPTLLPWHLERRSCSYVICDDHNNVVCELWGSYQYKSDEVIREQEKADGDLIIKAVEYYLKEAKDAKKES